MKTVFLRELLLSLRRIATYVCIGVSALAMSVFFITSNLTYVNSTIASTVSFAQLASAAVMPIFAFVVYTHSKNADPDAFYDMLPIKDSSIFFCAASSFSCSNSLSSA